MLDVCVRSDRCKKMDEDDSFIALIASYTVVW